MSASPSSKPNMREALDSGIRALRRLADYQLPAVVQQRLLDLGERKEFLTPEELQELHVLVALSEDRSIDKLQAAIALRQLEEIAAN